MEPLSRREREKFKMREKIIDAAKTLFLQGGPDKVVMRGIAEMIEYSPAAIYRYFKSKEDILTALFYKGFELLNDQRRGRPDIDGIESPIERLRASCLMYIDFALEHSEYYQLMFGQQWPVEDCDIDFDAPPMTAYFRFHGMVEECIQAGEIAGEDSFLVTNCLWSAMHGFVTLEQVDMIGFLPEDARGRDPEAFVDYILRS